MNTAPRPADTAPDAVDAQVDRLLRDLPPDRPVLIAGPTASGKSALAARIVREGGGVIVNADALQVYGNWRLLTARPSAGEEAALPHRLYGHVAAGDSYSVGHWLREVAEILEGPNAPRPVVVGGTGLYFRALTEGLAPIPATPADLRAELDARLREEGVAALAAEIVREDPATAGWRRIMCTSAGNHPYAGAWWPDGHVIGYEHTFVNMVADIMATLAGKEPIVPLPNFADAYETQRVLEAAMLSAKHRSAVRLSEVK